MVVPIAYAASLTVNTVGDELNSDDDCSLREALQAANTDAAVDGCAAGSGADTSAFAPALAGGVISLSIIGDTTLGPSPFGVTSTISIIGDATSGLIIERNSAASEMRLFHVSASGTLHLKYLTIRGGVARGFDGGSAYNGGTGGGAAGMAALPIPVLWAEQAVMVAAMAARDFTVVAVRCILRVQTALAMAAKSMRCSRAGLPL